MDAQMLADERDIVALTVDYTWALDTKEFERLRDVFTPDATAELGWPLQGVDAIIDRIAAALVPLDASQHLVGNHQVRVDGDRATCRCQLQAQHVRASAADLGDRGVNFIIGGHYEDRMVRTRSGWRIAHRTLVQVWNEGNRAVVAPPPPS